MAVTKQRTVTPHRSLLLLASAICLASQSSQAVVLPKERADILWHRYDGGGMVIDGPSVLVRKNFADKVSVSSNYYVDNVSSASIDVITSGASEYTEERKEYSADISLLNEKSSINVGYTNSDESDYTADSFRMDISQDFFGDQLTASMGYSQADDEVRKNGVPEFKEEVKRRHYRAGLSWILTKSNYISVDYEAITDEGYLNNPYREVRFEDPFTRINEPELYPHTRNSDAYSVKFAHHLPWPGAIKSRVSYFSDSWSINAYSIELEYSHKLSEHFIVDVRTRYYAQDQAEFYRDVFPNTTSADSFKARDKELSSYDNITLGLGGSYTLPLTGFFEEFRSSMQLDWMTFDYENFSDASTNRAIGDEPLYSFEAYALRLFFTLTY